MEQVSKHFTSSPTSEDEGEHQGPCHGPAQSLPLPPPFFTPCTAAPPGPVTLIARAFPFSALSSTSYITSSPSASVVNPSAWIAEWWTKISSPPSSGLMNPNPLRTKNIVTFPVGILR